MFVCAHTHTCTAGLAQQTVVDCHAKQHVLRCIAYDNWFNFNRTTHNVEKERENLPNAMRHVQIKTMFILPIIDRRKCSPKIMGIEKMKRFYLRKEIIHREWHVHLDKRIYSTQICIHISGVGVCVRVCWCINRIWTSLRMRLKENNKEHFAVQK